MSTEQYFFKFFFLKLDLPIFYEIVKIFSNVLKKTTYYLWTFMTTPRVRFDTKIKFNRDRSTTVGSTKIRKFAWLPLLNCRPRREGKNARSTFSLIRIRN